MCAYEQSEEGGTVYEPKMAVLQADSLIAYHFINKLIDMICSTNSDFFALIRPECLLLRSALFRKGREKKKGIDRAISLGSFEIADGCNTQYNRMKDALTSL
eukprot:3396963-Ditylum_brightwellii.AAC.1